ncbi:phage tail tube protein [Kitasatospora sp. NBC_01266]|uniref:phage tail tube protein n=1 Tax=Kitasatospora sp. NBC_01266 TaxID=2903572 RepID=UPI002E31FB67|nr:phage tail tube protein [Kitasatospora sp. NBC_01266]
MPKPSHLTAFGLGKESIRGTGVAGTLWVPWKTLTPKDDVAILEDTGQRGAPVDLFGTAAGPRGSELSWGGDVFADSIGVPLCSVLPDVTVTGSSAPYSTAFSVLCSGDTQPPSFTGTLFDPLGTWYYPGLQVSELGFKWNADGFLNYSAKATGWGYTPGTTPTPSFTPGLAPQPNWNITNKIAGSQVFVQDGELNITRKITVVRGANGTQNPYAIWSGDASVNGKLTLIMENTTQRAAFQAATQQAFDVSYTAGSGATATGLDLHCSTVTYTEGTPTYGKDYIELPVSFKAVANTSDIGGSGGYSQIKATLTNAMPSGTYK